MGGDIRTTAFTLSPSATFQTPVSFCTYITDSFLWTKYKHIDKCFIEYDKYNK